VARMGGRETCIDRRGNLKERGHLEDQGVDRVNTDTVLKETGYRGVVWIRLAQGRDKRQ
jgi:hypothetical protein